MSMFILVFSFLHRHKSEIFNTFVEVIITNLIMSNEINKSTIIKIIICSIVNFIYQKQKG